MALDLFCYATLNVEEFNICVKKIMQEHPELFPRNYLMSNIIEASEIGITLEHGMSNVNSFWRNNIEQ